ncbi:MAG: ABC transporter substrate-binding protein [Chloroflexi bacterium]|nr:ABC transporter substrate-binding protein [Chloroflexota bacterium]
MQTARVLKVVASLMVVSLGCAPAAPAPPPKATAPSSRVETPVAKPPAELLVPSPTPKAAAESRPEPGRYGGILTIGTPGDPPSLDLHQESAAYAMAPLSSAYDGLLKPNVFAWPEYKPVSSLAASWEVSADGKLYTFHLVKGAKFHNGAPVTAEDVKFSLDRTRNPQPPMARSPRKELLSAIANIDAPDDSTVKIALGYAQASFIPYMGAPGFGVMPKEVVLARGNDMTKTVVGSGPFKFKDYKRGVSWELEKNPEYFVKGRPYLDGIKGYLIPDPFTRFAAFRVKSFLFWDPASPYMAAGQAKMVEKELSDKIALQWQFHPAWYGAYFNVTRPPWSDVRVRQAVSLTFDRKRMVAIGLEGAGVAGMAAMPPGEWGLQEEEMIKVPGYARPDLDAAKKLLAEAGFPQGFKAQGVVRKNKAHEDMAVLVKDAISKIGIDLDIMAVETATWYEYQFGKRFDFMPAGSGSVIVDPDLVLGDHYLSRSPRNYTGYSNPAFDDLYAKQAQTSDPLERRKIVWEAQRILLKDVPIVIAYWSNIPYAWWREVRGFTPPVSFFYTYRFEEVWLSK